MIHTIGVIYQDRNSLGFLEGLRERLRCSARFVDPPAPMGITRDLPRKQARIAWEYFRKHGVDLVVRFTDADKARWTTVRSGEFDRIPSEARSLWICGVAVENVEHWLGNAPAYLEQALGIPQAELLNPQNRTGAIKRAISAKVRLGEDSNRVVARLVTEAPVEAFKKWLADEAFRAFYSDCRKAALRVECDVPNELNESQDE